MHTQKFNKIGIIGLGLIGGSLAKAIRKASPETMLLGCDVDVNSLNTALSIGSINKIVEVTGFDSCDIVFVCTPPQTVCDYVQTLSKQNICLITDVASVKLNIVNGTTGIKNFVAGHPMAGSEGSGFEAADEDLFIGARYIICSDGEDKKEQIAMLKDCIELIGAYSIEMDAEIHDKRIAVISHLPHVAAFALSKLSSETHDETMKQLIGGGFRDTTRIAASSPRLWSDIFCNSTDLSRVIGEYIEMLSRFKNLLDLKSTDEMTDFLSDASKYRKGIPEGLKAKNLSKENK